MFLERLFEKNVLRCFETKVIAFAGVCRRNCDFISKCLHASVDAVAWHDGWACVSVYISLGINRLDIGFQYGPY